ncbi:MAG: hypothetical protein ACP5MZ_03170 [Candidatus Micrarchaeia archaeon]
MAVAKGKAIAHRGIKIYLEEHNNLIEEISIEATELTFPKEHVPILEMHLIGRRMTRNEIKKALAEVYEATGSSLSSKDEEALVKSILATKNNSSAAV